MKKRLSYSLAAALAACSWLALDEVGHVVLAQGNSPRSYVAPTVFQAAGPNKASIQSTVNQFRAAFGGDNNGNAAGPLNAGRREINWDGGGSTATATSGTPFTGFLLTRGALFSTRGSGFVQAPTSGLATTFGNLTYDDGIFKPFSDVRLFASIGGNDTEVQFFVPGSGGTPATTRGFGAVFTDVDQPDGDGPGGKRGNRGASTLIEYYGYAGDILFSSFVPASPGNGNLSFFAILFDDARIGRVRITSGDVAPGPHDDAGTDIVVMDDFIYGEPRLLQ